MMENTQQKNRKKAGGKYDDGGKEKKCARSQGGRMEGMMREL
jgi:hypothetical protein